jgi:hypothetical protein
MYYIFDKDKNFLKESDTPFNVDETIQPKEGYQLKGIEIEKPEYDSSLYFLVSNVIDDFEKLTRTFDWNIQEHPLEKIQEIAEFNAKIIEKEELKVIDVNKLTLEERIERLEKLYAN